MTKWAAADRISTGIAVAALITTLGVGTCSTNARIDDVNANVNARFDSMQADIRELRALVFEYLKGSGEPAD